MLLGEKTMALKIKLYTPHEAQWQMHSSSARFKVICCGRRFGKSWMSVNELVKFCNENSNVNTMLIAPTYKQSKLNFDLMIKHFKRATSSYIKNPMTVYWTNGSITKFSSAESGDTLRGDSLHMIVLDECAFIDESLWQEILRPMLSDTEGKAILVSTPHGRNWFYHMWCRGQDPEYPEYESFKFPTSSNPHIKKAEIAEAKHSLPADVFKQEYLAEFLESEGLVFKNVHACVDGELQDHPTSGKTYTLSWDPAKHTDYSVCIVMDDEIGRVVAFDRFRRIDYSAQINIVAELARKWKAKVIIDSTGVGDPILEQLKKANLNVEGYHFTNTSKQQLIEHLAVLMERKEIRFPDIKVLINELMSYQYEITRAGNMKYNAPSSMHDDCVIALALAAWGAKHKQTPMARWL